jgi:lipopolysaccharide transport system ATP-binding protein
VATVISTENLGKKYLIGHQPKEPYAALRDVLVARAIRFGREILRAFKETNSSSRKEHEEFWALRDVSFEIKEGDRVGIIGRNGAGKSTLLKILSRITEPSTGRIKIKGRVASLLEVGTGFHPELTGRENIFLNGAVLGMTKAEIRKKFDEIVAFAEVEKFLDTPVKRYSSGMYVRLAFAVAAHLEPEILIIDEVLAVGDAQFQKKCLGKMEEVGKSGRTVIFVSHNIQAVRQLCTRAILLDAGSLVTMDSPQEVIDLYLQRTVRSISEEEMREAIKRLPEDPVFRLDAIQLSQMGQPVFELIRNGSPLEISVRYCIKRSVKQLRVFIDMLDDQGGILFRSFHDEDTDGISHMMPGIYVSKVVIPGSILAAFPHMLCVKAGIFGVRYTLPEEGICIPLHVEQTSSYNRAYVGDRFVGRLALVLKWEINKIDRVSESVHAEI